MLTTDFEIEATKVAISSMEAQHSRADAAIFLAGVIKGACTLTDDNDSTAMHVIRRYSKAYQTIWCN